MTVETVAVLFVVATLFSFALFVDLLNITRHPPGLRVVGPPIRAQAFEDRTASLGDRASALISEAKVTFASEFRSMKWGTVGNALEVAVMFLAIVRVAANIAVTAVRCLRRPLRCVTHVPSRIYRLTSTVPAFGKFCQSITDTVPPLLLIAVVLQDTLEATDLVDGLQSQALEGPITQVQRHAADLTRLWTQIEEPRWITVALHCAVGLRYWRLIVLACGLMGGLVSATAIACGTAALGSINGPLSLNAVKLLVSRPDDESVAVFGIGLITAGLIGLQCSYRVARACRRVPGRAQPT